MQHSFVALVGTAFAVAFPCIVSAQSEVAALTGLARARGRAPCTSSCFPIRWRTEFRRGKGTMAFMFETRFPQRVSAYAAAIAQLQPNYANDGSVLVKRFDPKRP